MSRGRTPFRLAAVPLLAGLAGCSGNQSALVPRGVEAGQISTLFWGMTGFLALVMVAVIVLAVLARSGGERLRRILAHERFVLGAGVAFPAIALTLLFAYGLLIMASRASAGIDPGAVRARIIGEQWWWRVVYELPDGRQVQSANELYIPVGSAMPVALETADVIHSFWVPNLAGKLDMIPGRTNVLTLAATEPGISRGQCAEYCGGAHAFMSFNVVATPPDEFAERMAHEAADAVAPEAAGRGAALFAQLGCGGCHAVRGTQAQGVIGPDLTHVGSRRSLGAATLPNTAEAFAAWIRNNQHIKPGNRMPEYDVLSEEDLSLLAVYLESLE